MRVSWILGAFLACAGAAGPGRAEDVLRYDLEQLRAIARERHPTLEAARAAIAEAAAIRTERRVLADPELRAAYAHASGLLSGSESAFELTQAFELPGLRGGRTRAADSAIRRAEHDRLAAEALVDFTVGQLFARALLARREVEITSENEVLARRLMELLERRVDLGESPPLEALRARAEWFARRQASIEAQHGQAAVLAVLDTFCGRALGPRFEVAGSLDGPSRLPAVADLEERLERVNPQLLAARAAAEEAAAASQVERRRAFPGLSLSAFRESEVEKTATGLGLGLAIPIWNRNRGAVAAAAAAADVAHASVRELSLELRSALRRAVEEHEAAAATVALYDEGWREASRSVVQIAEFSFENGEASLLDTLDAQRSYLAVGLAEAEARARLVLARLEVERLVGGLPPEEVVDEGE